MLTTGIFHRFKIISDVDYVLILAGIGLLEISASIQAGATGVGAVASGLGLAIPSIGSKSVNIASQENLIGTSPNNAISKNAGGGVGRTTVQTSGVTGQAVNQ